MTVEVHRTELDSGLVLLVIPRPHPKRVVIEALVRVGSRYEDARLNGISHFLEHMLHRGTRRLGTSHDVALAFESHGGSLDAATAVDHGLLGVSCPVECFDAVIELHADVFRNPTFTDMDIEKGIVREEILESLDDRGAHIDPEDLIREIAFRDHPLGRPITGLPDHLDRFTVDDLKQHHGRHYVGDATVLTVVGPVSPSAVEQGVARAYGGLPRGGRLPVAPPPKQTGPRTRYVSHPSDSQTSLRVAFRAPAVDSPLEPATEILLRLLDDGMATRLYHELCDRRGLCYDVGASYEAYADSGLFLLDADCSHERAKTVLDQLLAVVDDLRQGGPTEAELERTQQRLRWEFDAMLDNPSALAGHHGEGALHGTNETLEERLSVLTSVDGTAVRDAAGELFRNAGLSVVAVGHLRRKEREWLKRRVVDFG